MKLYGRLLLTLATSPFKDRIAPLETAVSTWTVLPNDLDLFGHMNNGRYAMVMDLARVDFMARLGLMGKVLKSRWIVPVGSTRIEFRKALKPFTRYEIHTRLCYWDDAWFYFRQDFVIPAAEPSAAPVLAASAYVKAVFRDDKGTVPSQRIVDAVMALQDIPYERPALTLELARQFDLPLPMVRQTPQTSQALVSSPVSMAQPALRPKAGATREPIAIVGIGCRFPGGVENVDDLWSILLEGKDCVIDIPSERWDPRKFHDPSGQSPGRAYVNKAGILTRDVHLFDASFFGISPREAEIMDPMQRLLLEVSWEAFEDAGISPKAMAGQNMSVFVGGFVVDSMIKTSSPLNRNFLGSQSATGNSLTLLANRLSYFFDLRGPSISLDTACSSSLVAVHQACQSIWSGESDSALVGGVNMLLAPETQVTMCKGQFLSPNGRCNTFGAGADGYVRGEGSALVILKPLSQALADGNRIYSVIRGTASNQDGRTNGITVPNGEAQQQAVRAALAVAGLHPSQIHYMEAHGTGTSVGDPIEANALGEVLGQGRNEPCPIGSLKTNLGHMEASAGIGGLIKAALVLKHRTLVPHLHLDEVNPQIDLQALNLRVPTQVEPIRHAGSLYAGVNSFGYGGTNAHAILESPPEQGRAFCESVNPLRGVALTLSAESDASLKALAAKVLSLVEQPNTNLSHLAVALASQRAHLTQRAWIQGSSSEQLVAGLKGLTEGGTRPDNLHTGSRVPGRVMFVYTGMGPQWWAMGRELYHKEPVYRAAIDECDALFQDISGWSLRAALMADEAESRIAQTEVAQPANLAVQVGLTLLLRSWGLEADGIVGHSIGEVGAAWASGGLSLDNALRVAYHRSRLQAKTAGKGGMLAVGISLDEAYDLVDRSAGKIAIGAINSPGAVTLSGQMAALQEIAAELEAQQRFNRFLKVEVPYHSPVMDEIEQELLDSLRPVQTLDPTTTLYSTVSGELMEGRHDAAYWWRNVRESVMFSKAITSALDAGFTTFVEVGPHPVLASSILETAKASGHAVNLVSTLVRASDEMACLARTAAKLYCQGREPQWSAYLGRASMLDLPAYPWNRSLHRFESARAMMYRLPYTGHPLVVRETRNPVPVWHVELNRQALPYVQDHQVAGNILFPGAGYVELGLALAKQRQIETGQESDGILLERIEFLHPAVVLADAAVSLAVHSDDNQEFKVYYRTGEHSPELCAKGFFFNTGLRHPAVDRDTVDRCFSASHSVDAVRLEPDELYRKLESKGLVYGPDFRAVQHVIVDPGKTWAHIVLPQNLDPTGYFLHPVLLDAALHSLIAGVSDTLADYNVIPMGIERLQWFGATPTELVACGTMQPQSETQLRGDVALFTLDGVCVAKLSGLRCRVMPKAGAQGMLNRINQWVYQKEWVRLDVATTSADAASWLIISGAPDATTFQVNVLGSQPLPWAAPATWNSRELGRQLLAHPDVASRLTILDTRYLAVTQGADEMLMNSATSAAMALMTSLQSVATCAVQRYILLTPGVQRVTDADPVNLAGAVLEGLARTVMTECPRLHLTLVDVDATLGGDVDALYDRLSGLLSAMGDEQELALRGPDSYALRLTDSSLTAPAQEHTTLPALAVSAYEMQQGEAGRLDSLYYREMALPVPAEGEVVVEMAYSSINFKDLMKLLGLLSEDALSNTYFKNAVGLEGSGKIAAVGPGVSHVSVGDRVYTLGPVMRSHLRVPASNVVKLPEQVSLETGANLVTYMTVYHSLVVMARLQPGESVLIHSAAGGVGLAAINVAKLRGARVFATAGTEEKRDYLHGLGIDYVGDSRSLDFVDQVKAMTDGQGVDVVLNFTPGEIMKQSVQCLAPFGRFIELGKQSADRNETLPLRPFLENLCYISVDFDRLLNQRPQELIKVMVTVLDLLAHGRLAPLPCTVFPVSQSIAAFHTMARANYIGKLSLRHDRSEFMVRIAASGALFKADASYLITGGLGGFGLKVASWMADNGARNLVLLSRRGANSEEAQAAIREMEAQGVRVQVLAVDVSNYAALQTALLGLGQDLPAIKGVFHAAMVLDDKMFSELDADSLARVVDAKARGAWNLHRLTQSMDLDFMVLFSSISALVGNAGQANYVAANNFLDQLAHYRRAQGLACTSINWGVFEDTGVVARNSQLAKHLGHIGIVPIASSDATEALGLVLANHLTQVGVMNVDWMRFSGLLEAGSGNSRFKQLTARTDIGTEADAKQQLLGQFAALDNEARHALIRSALIESIASVMRLDPDNVKPSSTLRQLGMDSLMAVEIDVTFAARTGLDIPASDISSGPRIEELEARLLARLNDKLPVPEQASMSVA